MSHYQVDHKKLSGGVTRDGIVWIYVKNESAEITSLYFTKAFLNPDNAFAFLSYLSKDGRSMLPRKVDEINSDQSLWTEDIQEVDCYSRTNNIIDIGDPLEFSVKYIGDKSLFPYQEINEDESSGILQKL